MRTELSTREELAELEVVELRRLQELVQEELEHRRRESMPRARVAPDCRPMYLAGCPGRVGGWFETRREFFPDAGTEAYRRSTSWRVDASALILE